jgi:hypothetical protein
MSAAGRSSSLHAWMRSARRSVGQEAEPPTEAAPPVDTAPSRRSVHLPGFTPETLALIHELAEQLRIQPGQVVAVALRALVVALEQKVTRPRKARRRAGAPTALPPTESP